MIYNQIVTWTAFAILAMFKVVIALLFETFDSPFEKLLMICFQKYWDVMVKNVLNWRFGQYDEMMIVIR